MKKTNKTALWAFAAAGALLAFSIWKRKQQETTTTKTDKFADRTDGKVTLIPTQEKTVTTDLAEIKK